MMPASRKPFSFDSPTLFDTSRDYKHYISWPVPSFICTYFCTRLCFSSFHPTLCPYFHYTHGFIPFAIVFFFFFHPSFFIFSRCGRMSRWILLFSAVCLCKTSASVGGSSRRGFSGTAAVLPRLRFSWELLLALIVKTCKTRSCPDLIYFSPFWPVPGFMFMKPSSSSSVESNGPRRSLIFMPVFLLH